MTEQRTIPTLAAVLEERDRRRWKTDPVAWAEANIEWRPGEGLTGYQKDALRGIYRYGREAIRAPHGGGKSTTAAIAVLHFVRTRDGDPYRDWKVVTTASVWRQLDKYLWPEIHKWARRLKQPFEPKQLLDLNIKGATGNAFAVASDHPTAIEGAHAPSILYILDESKAIPDPMWDAIEGAFMGSPGDEAYALSISTPGVPEGRFYHIHKRRPGLENWHPIHWKISDLIAAGRMSQARVDQLAALWGEGSAVFKNRVLGEFSEQAEDGIIPLAWVEAAMERWKAWWESFQTTPYAVPLDTLGIDVGYMGQDKTTFAPRSGNLITELRRYGQQDTVASASYATGLLQLTGATAVVDAIGFGAGVYDQIRAAGLRAIPFVASHRAAIEQSPGKFIELKDRSGEMGFLNMRAAGWWGMRERLDPAYLSDVALPADDTLLGDLTIPRYKALTGGKYQVESKEDLRKPERMGRSPDDGDAVIMAFAREILTEMAQLAPLTFR